MTPQTSASPLPLVLNGRNLVPEGVEPEPRLSGVAPGLVHHAPLVARQVLVGCEIGRGSRCQR